MGKKSKIMLDKSDEMWYINNIRQGKNAITALGQSVKRSDSSFLLQLYTILRRRGVGFATACSAPPYFYSKGNPMIDPYKGVSELVRKRTSEAYLKQFRINLVELLEELMKMYKMTWGDLEVKLDRTDLRFSILRGRDAVCEFISMDDVFDLFEALGGRPVILGAPREDVASV